MNEAMAESPLGENVDGNLRSLLSRWYPSSTPFAGTAVSASYETPRPYVLCRGQVERGM